MWLLVAHVVTLGAALRLTFARDLGWAWAGMCFFAGVLVAGALLAAVTLRPDCQAACSPAAVWSWRAADAVTVCWYAGVLALWAGYRAPFKVVMFALGFPAGVLGFGTLWP